MPPSAAVAGIVCLVCLFVSAVTLEVLQWNGLINPPRLCEILDCPIGSTGDDPSMLCGHLCPPCDCNASQLKRDITNLWTKSIEPLTDNHTVDNLPFNESLHNAIIAIEELTEDARMEKNVLTHFCNASVAVEGGLCLATLNICGNALKDVRYANSQFPSGLADALHQANSTCADSMGNNDPCALPPVVLADEPVVLEELDEHDLAVSAFLQQTVLFAGQEILAREPHSSFASEVSRNVDALQAQVRNTRAMLSEKNPLLAPLELNVALPLLEGDVDVVADGLLRSGAQACLVAPYTCGVTLLVVVGGAFLLFGFTHKSGEGITAANSVSTALMASVRYSEALARNMFQLARHTTTASGIHIGLHQMLAHHGSIYRVHHNVKETHDAAVAYLATYSDCWFCLSWDPPPTQDEIYRLEEIKLAVTFLLEPSLQDISDCSEPGSTRPARCSQDFSLEQEWVRHAAHTWGHQTCKLVSVANDIKTTMQESYVLTEPTWCLPTTTTTTSQPPQPAHPSSLAARAVDAHTTGVFVFLAMMIGVSISISIARRKQKRSPQDCPDMKSHLLRNV